ncbi:SdrD B-like domain-containing protein [Staphylococcus aureus]|uniref:SdrD B-like domain-containing protein n=1 Tax=Staphylococcus aureus TaxID=1280 RepID=UPI0021D23E2B|nr:SdrD B-like domain-containing protein [Staphylococcus aureus]UXU12951.1 carboxypeptidase regulatory-like domain-containing protein [Staphylococcus aureus]
MKSNKSKMNKETKHVNKYSIRKFTLGTSSILVGSLIFLGNPGNVSAAESTSNETTTEETQSIDTSNSEQAAPKEVSSEEASVEQGVSKEVSSEEESSEQVAPKETSSEEESSEEVTPKETSSEEESSEEVTPKETSSEEESSEEVTPKEMSSEEGSTEQVAPKETSSEEVSSEQVLPKETPTEKKVNAQDETNKDTPSIANTSTENLYDDIQNVQSVEDKIQTLSSYLSENYDISKEEALSRLANQNIDYSNLSKGDLDYLLLKALSDQKDNKEVLATPVSLTSPRSMMRSVSLDNRLAGNSLNVNSKNVNDLIKVINHKITEGNKADHIIEAHNGEPIHYDTLFTIDNAVKKGDVMTVSYDPRTLPSDLTDGQPFTLPLYDSSGKLIADGVYDANNKQMVYTFTDYVDTYENVTARLSLASYIDKSKVPNEAKNLDITFKTGNTGTTYNADVVYQRPEVNGSSNIQSIFTQLNENDNTVEQTIYVNPLKKEANKTQVIVSGNGEEGETIVDANSIIKVYKVPNSQQLPQSNRIYDYSNFEDITATTNISYAGNQATINLGDINSAYVVKVVSKYTPESDGSIYAEQIAEMRSYDQYGRYFYSNYSNNILFSVSESGGDGDQVPEPTYKIGNYVWEDVDNDGIQGSSNLEKPLANVLVTIKYPDGSSKSVRTNAEGYYEFDGLLNNETYTITFTPPEGYTPTKSLVGDTEKDSNGLTASVTINNKDDMSIDSGFVKTVVEPTPEEATYTLGDKVWEDTDKDGVQNTNDPGIAGVKVTLTKPDGTTETTVTDENGNYKFTGLKNGEYTVTFETPEGYDPTIINVGDDALDSDGHTVKVKIENADDMTIDSGFVKTVVEPTPEEATYTLGDKVWEDTDKDGVQNTNDPGIAGVKVTLTKPDGTTETTVTDENGNYKFTGLKNGEYTVTFETPEGYDPTIINVGDDALDSDGHTVKVKIENADDMTIDSGFVKTVVEPTPEEATYVLGDKVWEDTNKDGVQNTNDPGIAGVKVTLTKPDGTTETTVTDENGNYKFTGLKNGEYTVTFETPEGYDPTIINVGDDALDSDGHTVKVKIENADDMTIDSGFVKTVVEPTPEEATYVLGDKVWEDTNKDGVQNTNDPGIAGVKVTLTKPDGTTETTVTDENGNYKFTGLKNGEYTVTFETPEGYDPTIINVGDDALDSDGHTVKVKIENADDMTIDSGFVKTVVEPTPEEATYVLGDKVWEDTNKDGVQNTNDPGIAGVKVTLTKPDGTTETTVTDENGNYKFTGLKNGEYTVTFETPEGYDPTIINVGDDALDSDGHTVKVKIENADDMTIDSGFVKTVVEPPVPSEPNEPGEPPVPSEPNEPGEPPVPSEPNNPGKPSVPNKSNEQKAHVAPTHHGKLKTSSTKQASHKDKKERNELPETGNDSNNTGLLSTLLIGLGGLLLFRKRNTKRD